MRPLKIEKIWLTNSEVWIRDSKGREASEQIAQYPTLSDASPAQRLKFEYDDFGIHWPDLDEDLSFECFFRKSGRNELYSLFMAHPELMA